MASSPITGFAPTVADPVDTVPTGHIDSISHTCPQTLAVDDDMISMSSLDPDVVDDDISQTSPNHDALDDDISPTSLKPDGVDSDISQTSPKPDGVDDISQTSPNHDAVDDDISQTSSNHNAVDNISQTSPNHDGVDGDISQTSPKPDGVDDDISQTFQSSKTAVDTSQASSDEDGVLSSGETAVSLTSCEQRAVDSSAKMLNSSSVDSALKVDEDHCDVAEDHCDTAAQLHVDSVMGQSCATGKDTCVESVSVSVIAVDTAHCEGRPDTSQQDDGADCVPAVTEYSHPVVGNNLNDSSSSLVIVDEDDDDAITLTEDYINNKVAASLSEDSLSSLVISNVCSIKDDWFAFSDKNAPVTSGETVPITPSGPGADKSLAELRSPSDAVGSSAQSSHGQNNDQSGNSGNSRSAELLGEATRNSVDQSTLLGEHTEGLSTGQPKMADTDYTSQKSLAIKIEIADKNCETQTYAASDPGGSVSCGRKRTFSETETEEDHSFKDMTVKRCTTDALRSASSGSGKGAAMEVASSEVDPQGQMTGQAGALSVTVHVAGTVTTPWQAGHQSQASTVCSTVGKTLILPSLLTARMDATQVQGAQAKSVVLSIPPSLGSSKGSISPTLGGSKRSLPPTLGGSKLLLPPTLGGSKIYVPVQPAAQTEKSQMSGSHQASGHVKALVKTYLALKDSIQQSAGTASGQSAQGSSRGTEAGTATGSSAATPPVYMPVSVNSIIQGRPKNQKQGMHSKTSIIIPPAPRSAPLCSVPPFQSFPPSIRLMTSSAPTAIQPLVSNTHKPAVYSPAEVPDNSKLVFKVPEVSKASQEMRVKYQVFPSSAVANTCGVASVTNAGSRPHTVQAETMVLSPSTQVDAANAEAKLSTGDMAKLIEGRNLVPSLAPPRNEKGQGVNSAYRCVECSTVYSTLVGYTAHVKRMSMVVRYACMLCKAALVFFNKCTFLAHLRKHSRSQGQLPNIKNCTMSITSLPFQLLPQTATQYMEPLCINRNKMVRCTECKELAPNATWLAQHFSGPETCSFEHSCEHCNMQLPTSCSLKAHLRLHHPEHHTISADPPFVCPECGLQFANALSLYQHVYAMCLHFQRCVVLRCFLCLSWYPTLQALEDHIFHTHPNHKRYRCTLCRRSYTTRESFVHHIPQVHKNFKELPNGVQYELMSSCKICSGEKDFIDGRQHAKKHVQRLLTEPPSFTFSCWLCRNCMYKSRGSMLQHLNQKHAAFKFTCSICQQGFVMLSMLRTHVLSAHGLKSSSSSELVSGELFHCTQCSVSSLVSAESALPHVMWHVVKKVTNTDTPTTPTVHVNKHSMDITVHTNNIKGERMYLCVSCGDVFGSNRALSCHLITVKHTMSVAMTTCPFCQRYDFGHATVFNDHVILCANRVVSADEQQVIVRVGCGSNLSRNEAPSRHPELHRQHPVIKPTNSHTPSSSVQARYVIVDSCGKTVKEMLAFRGANGADEGSNISPTNPRQESSRQVAVSAASGGAAQPGKSREQYVKTMGQNTEAAGETQGRLTPAWKSDIPLIFTHNGKVIGRSKMGDMQREFPFMRELGGKVVTHKVMKQVKSPGDQAVGSITDSARARGQNPEDTGSSSDHDHPAWPEDTQDVSDSDEEEGPLYHPCPLCGLTYQSADQLAAHRATIHRGQKTVLACQLCQKKGKKVVLSRQFLQRHLVRKHKMTKVAADAMMSEWSGQHTAAPAPQTQTAEGAGSKRKFTDSDSSSVGGGGEGESGVKRLRVAKEGEDYDYVCAKCQFSCPDRADFQSHIAAHSVAGAVQCQDCGMCFSALPSLGKHLAMVHKVGDPHAYITRNHIRLDQLPSDLLSHMDTLTPLGQPDPATPEVFHENLCHKVVTSPLQQSAEEVKGKKIRESSWLECTVCYKEFENEGSLKAHMRNHGMAFIRSRRSLRRQQDEDTASVVQGAGQEGK